MHLTPKHRIVLRAPRPRGFWFLGDLEEFLTRPRFEQSGFATPEHLSAILR